VGFWLRWGRWRRTVILIDGGVRFKIRASNAALNHVDTLTRPPGGGSSPGADTSSSRTSNYSAWPLAAGTCVCTSRTSNPHMAHTGVGGLPQD
jgi:hypothetical protein